MNVFSEYHLKKLRGQPPEEILLEKKKKYKEILKRRECDEEEEDGDANFNGSEREEEEEAEEEEGESNDKENETSDTEDPGSVGLGSALIIGKSNTGKSTLVKRLVEKYGGSSSSSFQKTRRRPIFILNDQTGKKTPGMEKISWDQIKTISKCCLIVEDLVKCNKRQVDVLSNLINVQNHHAQVRPIFFITHTLRGNGFFGLLKCYNAICLASEMSHADELKEIISRFRFGDELAKNCWEKFREGSEKGKYTFLWIDLELKKCALIKTEKKSGPSTAASIESAKESKISGLREKAKLYFSLMPDKTQKACIVLFDMICSKLYSSIDEHDLCLKGKVRGELFRASIVDYINVLLTNEEEDDSNSSSIKILHSYIISKNVQLPKCYIRNKSML